MTIDFKVKEKKEKQARVYKLSKDSKLALTATFLKCLSEQMDLQELLTNLEFVAKKGEICVLNPPENVSFAKEQAE